MDFLLRVPLKINLSDSFLQITIPHASSSTPRLYKSLQTFLVQYSLMSFANEELNRTVQSVSTTTAIVYVTFSFIYKRRQTIIKIPARQAQRDNGFTSYSHYKMYFYSILFCAGRGDITRPRRKVRRKNRIRRCIVRDLINSWKRSEPRGVLLLEFIIICWNGVHLLLKTGIYQLAGCVEMQEINFHR